MKRIPLTQGKVALVDDRDFSVLCQFNWYAWQRNGYWYAARNLPRENGQQRQIQMHRFLTPGVALVDHRDGNGLNNQRNNLRPASRAQNRQNSQSGRRYKGVYKDRNSWRAAIIVAKKFLHLGNFVTEREAACAYDTAAQRYFGEFALLNFPQRTTTEHE